MIEQRRVRFASIDGLRRTDIAIAAEIWCSDVVRQSWATREVQKLAVVLRRYLADPVASDMRLGALEGSSQLDRKQVVEALRQMQIFGVVEGFGIDGDLVRVSLTLTILQRLAALETRQRLEALGADGLVSAKGDPRRDGDRWLPAVTPGAADAETGSGQGEPQPA